MDQGRIWPLVTDEILGVTPLEGNNSKIKFSKSTDVGKQIVYIGVIDPVEFN